MINYVRAQACVACLHPEDSLLQAAESKSVSRRWLSNTNGSSSQCSLHNAPIFRLLLKVAVNGTHQCESFNFCGDVCPNHFSMRRLLVSERENTNQQTNKRKTNKRLHKQKRSNKHTNEHTNKHTNKDSSNVCLHRNKKHATANQWPNGVFCRMLGYSAGRVPCPGRPPSMCTLYRKGCLRLLFPDSLSPRKSKHLNRKRLLRDSRSNWAMNLSISTCPRNSLNLLSINARKSLTMRDVSRAVSPARATQCSCKTAVPPSSGFPASIP